MRTLLPCKYYCLYRAPFCPMPFSARVDHPVRSVRCQMNRTFNAMNQQFQVGFRLILVTLTGVPSPLPRLEASVAEVVPEAAGHGGKVSALGQLRGGF